MNNNNNYYKVYILLGSKLQTNIMKQLDLFPNNIYWYKMT